MSVVLSYPRCGSLFRQRWETARYSRQTVLADFIKQQKCTGRIGGIALVDTRRWKKFYQTQFLRDKLQSRLAMGALKDGRLDRKLVTVGHLGKL